MRPTYHSYTAPISVNERHAMTAAPVMLVTALGISGSSLLASRYASAIIRAAKALTKIGQQTIPALPCLHAIYPPRRRKMQEIPRSAWAKLMTLSLGGGIAAAAAASAAEDMISYKTPIGRFPDRDTGGG